MIKINKISPKPIISTMRDIGVGDVVNLNGDICVCFMNGNKKQLFDITKNLIIHDASRLGFIKCVYARLEVEVAE